MKTEILYQTKETNEEGKPFLTIKKAIGYYTYAERLGINSVAFILYDKNKSDCFGLIYENKPPLDEVNKKEMKLTTAFGGSIDKDIS